MEYINGYFILNDEIMLFIRNFILFFSTISIIYTLLVALFMQKVFIYFKKDKIYSYIPFYNVFLILKMIKLPEYYGLLQFIPIANIPFIILVNKKLAQFFDKNPDYTWGLTLLPFKYMPNLVTLKGKAVRPEEVKKSAPKVPKYSMKDLDTNLLTDKELENLNKIKPENLEVDSIFKADIDLIESASPYKAGRQKIKVEEEEPLYERETIKKVESVKARDIKREGKFIKEEDVTEKVDL